VTTIRKVPGQARDGVILTLLALLLATGASAQVVPTGTPAADIVLTQALADQRLFLTCTALEPQNHQLILDFWAADVAAATAILADNGVPEEAIAAFTQAALPENLMPAPDTPFATLREICSDPLWFQRMMRRDFTELAVQLPKALE
jgi:hypothetical protein